jgi:hypothetical protein
MDYLGHYGMYVCMVSQLRGVACIGLRDYSITVCRFFLQCHRAGGGGGDLSPSSQPFKVCMQHINVCN